MRILGLDYGEKRLGLAISDEMGITAQGLPTLTRKGLEKDLAALEKVIRSGQNVRYCPSPGRRRQGYQAPTAPRVAIRHVATAGWILTMSFASSE